MLIQDGTNWPQSRSAIQLSPWSLLLLSQFLLYFLLKTLMGGSEFYFIARQIDYSIIV
jgi:hypothetical protein